jgi:hypothetical protein
LVTLKYRKKPNAPIGRPSRNFAPDYGQLEFSQGQLKFPMAGKANTIQVRDGLYGERSAGKAALSTGRAEVFVRVGGGEGGHGPEDSAKVPTESAHAKRDAKEARYCL